MGAISKVKLPYFIICRLRKYAFKKMISKDPDFIIGSENDPYLKRWFIIPRNRFFNIYLHEFIRSDDDRALHDHPWVNCSIIVYGSVIEHTIPQGGIHMKNVLTEGDVKCRLTGKLAHRIEVDHPAITIFITGPRYREWGFHCPKGWVHFKDFTSAEDSGKIGKGCN